MNFDLDSGFVNASAICSSVPIHFNSISPLPTSSRILCSSNLTQCANDFEYSDFAALMADLLSVYMIGIPFKCAHFLRNALKIVSNLEAVDIAIYSLSIDEVATTFCFSDFQAIVPPAYFITTPVVDFPLGSFQPSEASLYASRLLPSPVNIKPNSEEPFKYRIIRSIFTQSDSV